MLSVSLVRQLADSQAWDLSVSIIEPISLINPFSSLYIQIHPIGSESLENPHTDTGGTGNAGEMSRGSKHRGKVHVSSNTLMHTRICDENATQN